MSLPGRAALKEKIEKLKIEEQTEERKGNLSASPKSATG